MIDFLGQLIELLNDLLEDNPFHDFRIGGHRPVESILIMFMLAWIYGMWVLKRKRR